jgi:hypothetical protein
MSPTVLRENGYRFFFFSREETRMHIHIICAEGEAKYWLEPVTELVKNHNLSKAQLREIEHIIEAHYGEFKQAWEKHFRG